MQLRSTFFCHVALHHWVIGAWHFNTTTLSQRSGHPSPSDAMPHSREIEAATAPVQIQKPSNSQKVQLLSSASTDMGILILEDTTTAVPWNAVHQLPSDKVPHPSRTETTVIPLSHAYFLIHNEWQHTDWDTSVYSNGTWHAEDHRLNAATFIAGYPTS